MHNNHTKDKTDCVVAEARGTLKSDQVNMRRSFHFQCLKACIFDEVKFVNSNESTHTCLFDDINSISLASLE